MTPLLAAAAHHIPLAHLAIAVVVTAVIAGLVYAVRSRKKTAEQSERSQEQPERDQGRGS
ncbi:MAG: hypothetical protein ACYDD7_02470 [Acidimicrobiales bacterium]